MSTDTKQVNAINKAQLALKKLRGYFAFAGREDVLSLQLRAAAGDSTATDILALAGLGSVAPEDLADPPTPKYDKEYIETLLFLVLDTTEAAYFTKDMLTDSGLFSKFDIDADAEGVQFTGVEEFVQILPPSSRSTFEAANSDLTGASFVGGEDGIGAQDIIKVASLDDNNVPEQVEGAVQVELPPGLGNGMDPNKGDGLGSLSSFVFPNLQISLASRNTSSSVIFLNAIPTHEMSRCSPYFNMQIITTARPGALGATESFNIMSFLGGAVEDDKIHLSRALAKDKLATAGLSAEASIEVTSDASAAAATTSTGFDANVSAAGMELFTSPQTMINPEFNSTSTRRVLDPMLPLATLNSFRVSMEGVGHEFLTNRTAVLDFTIHDRSRMPEFAPLLSSELFGTTTVLVEYGWSHPQGGDADDNAFGALLNTMRNTALFRVVVTNFTIQTDGQVRVTCRLATQGADDLKALPVVTGPLMPVQMFSTMMESYFQQYFSGQLSDVEGSENKTETQKAKELAEIRKDMSVMVGKANAPTSVIPRSLYDKILALVYPKSVDGVITQPSPSDIKDVMGGTADSIMGADPNDTSTGELASSDSSAMKAIMEKVAGMTPGGDQKDPYLTTTPHCTSPAGADPLDPPYSDSTRISLGKIFMNFVGYPLAASGRVDEVQMFFYRFNHLSMKARKLSSIASFEININEFQEWALEGFGKKSPGMSINSFISSFSNRFVKDLSNPNYGDIALKYQAISAAQESASAEGVSAEAVDQIQNDIKGIRTEIEEMINAEYSGQGGGKPTFILPDVKIYLECMPAYVIGETGAKSVSSSKSILRIHVYDNHATPNADELFLINTLNGSKLAFKVGEEGVVTPTPEPNLVADSGASTGAGARAEETGMADHLATIDTDKYVTYISKATAADMKELIKSTMPSITFGSQYSAIKTLSLSADTSGQANNVLLLRTQSENSTGATEAGDSAGSAAEPMIVIPGSVKMTVLGCPTIDRAQQFFIDMGTGTTADNIYVVTHVNHVISPGIFDTQVTLSFVQNATISTLSSKLRAAYIALGEIQDAEEASPDRDCVVATHAVANGSFTYEDKKRAVLWCTRHLHGSWWGEAFRRGYRDWGNKMIREGKVENHYQEFQDYVDFAIGKSRNLRTAFIFIHRTAQFFLKGLFIKEISEK